MKPWSLGLYNTSLNSTIFTTTTTTTTINLLSPSYGVFHNYIPGTNHVSRVYNVTDILWLQYTVHVILVLFEVCALCPVPLLSVALDVMLSKHFVQIFSELFKMVPVAPVIIGIVCVFTFHICCISVSLYILKSFWLFSHISIS
jgi:hypothetical protein